jgi:Gram-negative bacterial TonB protein C-terminal
MLLSLFGSLALAASQNPMRVAPIGVRPAIDPGTWIGPDDYPKAALRAGAAGITGFVLQVGVDGRAKDCFVTQTSGNDGLDAATCALLGDRARFLPALDAQGRPIIGSYRSSVRWQIPATPKVPLVPFAASMQFDVSGDGHPSNCTTSGALPTSKDRTELADLCKGLIAGVSFQPIAGNAKATHVVITLNVSVTSSPTRIDTPLPRP